MLRAIFGGRKLDFYLGNETTGQIIKNSDYLTVLHTYAKRTLEAEYVGDGEYRDKKGQTFSLATYVKARRNDLEKYIDELDNIYGCNN